MSTEEIQYIILTAIALFVIYFLVKSTIRIAQNMWANHKENVRMKIVNGINGLFSVPNSNRYAEIDLSQPHPSLQVLEDEFKRLGVKTA